MENAEEKYWIEKDAMENKCIYKCDGRNFDVGIWFKDRMYGLRRKFGDEFIDTERHWDDGAHGYGTCKPLKKISYPLRDRADDNLFSLTNWRSNIVLHDMLSVAEAIVSFEEDQEEKSQK